MFRIGEFSRMGQVSVRMLRHYDDLGLLKPARVDRFTDNRFYTLEQLPRVHRLATACLVCQPQASTSPIFNTLAYYQYQGRSGQRRARVLSV